MDYFASLRFLSSASFQSFGKYFETSKKLITDGTKTNEVTVIAYLIDSRSLKFSLKRSIIQPEKVGPPPKAIMFNMKKNNAVDIALM